MFSKFLVTINKFGLRTFLTQSQNLERCVFNSPSSNGGHIWSLHRNFQNFKDREDEMKEKCEKEKKTTTICPELEKWASLSGCERGDFCEKQRHGQLNDPPKSQRKPRSPSKDC